MKTLVLLLIGFYLGFVSGAVWRAIHEKDEI